MIIKHKMDSDNMIKIKSGEMFLVLYAGTWLL